MAGVSLLIGKLAFAVMGVVVGFKLAATVKREGVVGLHTVALAAICIGGVGLIMLPVGESMESIWLIVLGEAGVRIGMLLFCLFLVRTFRHSTTGYLLGTAMALALVATIVWDITAQQPTWDYDYTRPSSHANQLSIAVPFLWATIESGLLWSRGRKQLAIGLGDPVVVERYGIWCFATACFAGVAIFAILAGVLSGSGFPVLAEAAQTMRGVFYLAVTAAIWRGLFRTSGARGNEAQASSASA